MLKSIYIYTQKYTLFIKFTQPINNMNIWKYLSFTLPVYLCINNIEILPDNDN